MDYSIALPKATITARQAETGPTSLAKLFERDENENNEPGLSTTTGFPTPSSVPLRFEAPAEFVRNDSIPLWKGGPRFDDMAAMEDRVSNHWQEISAVVDALIQHDNR